MPKRRRSIDDDADDDEDDISSSTRKAKSVLLCNLQVLEALQPRVQQRRLPNKTTAPDNKNNQQKKKVVDAFRHRDWIEAQVVEYITKHTPSLQLKSFQNAQKLKQILLAPTNNKHAVVVSRKTKNINDDDDNNKNGHNNNIDPSESKEQQTLSSRKKGFGLNEAKALQMINLVPTEPVEIHLIIPDVHERHTQYQEELLSTIKSFQKARTMTRS